MKAICQLIYILSLTTAYAGPNGSQQKGHCVAEFKNKCGQHKGNKQEMKKCVESQVSQECRQKMKKARGMKMRNRSKNR